MFRFEESREMIWPQPQSSSRDTETPNLKWNSNPHQSPAGEHENPSGFLQCVDSENSFQNVSSNRLFPESMIPGPMWKNQFVANSTAVKGMPEVLQSSPSAVTQVNKSETSPPLPEKRPDPEENESVESAEQSPNEKGNQTSMEIDQSSSSLCSNSTNKNSDASLAIHEKYTQTVSEDLKPSKESKEITERKKKSKSQNQREQRITLLPFIMELLEAKHSCIRWLNEEKRVFLIRDLKAISRIWGERKRNKGDTETFLRAMRFALNPNISVFRNKRFFSIFTELCTRNLPD